MNTTSTERIVKTPDICGARACIAGHRIRVADIVVWHERRGYSPDEVVSQETRQKQGATHPIDEPQRNIPIP